MFKSFKYRIYPNKVQKEIMAANFGCTRFVYNHYLDKYIEKAKNDSFTFDYRECLLDLKSLINEFSWLKEAKYSSLYSSIKNLDTNIKRKKVGTLERPKFKSRKFNKNSYHVKNENDSIVYGGKYIFIPGIGKIKTRNTLIQKGKILNATISKTVSDKYFVSLCCCNVQIDKFKKTGKSVGLDLGIKDLVITSDGDKFINERFFDLALSKIARLKRNLSRKSRGGSNYEKARIKLARYQEKVKNRRIDKLHKLSNYIVKNYDIICIEDLDVQKMMASSTLSRKLADASFSEFVRQLIYKSKWYDKKVIKIDRYFKSSQTCHVCGFEDSSLKDLNIREWACPWCLTTHDRDINAAINIKIQGLKTINV